MADDEEPEDERRDPETPRSPRREQPRRGRRRARGGAAASRAEEPPPRPRPPRAGGRSEEPAAEERRAAPRRQPAAEEHAPAEPRPPLRTRRPPRSPTPSDRWPRRPSRRRAEAPAEPRSRRRPKDVVPGADLEPIAIERRARADRRGARRREAEEEERAAREAARDRRRRRRGAPRRAAVSVPADAQIQATGKRKSAVARVIVRSGSGELRDQRPHDRGLLPARPHQSIARQPLVTAGYDGNVDVKVRVHGGGISGQAGAVRHGIARALTELDPELRGDLKRRGLLTRDARARSAARPASRRPVSGRSSRSARPSAAPMAEQRKLFGTDGVRGPVGELLTPSSRSRSAARPPPSPRRSARRS